jgi:hypothetical protein
MHQLCMRKIDWCSEACLNVNWKVKETSIGLAEVAPLAAATVVTQASAQLV